VTDTDIAAQISALEARRYQAMTDARLPANEIPELVA
jgi:hypothetical protein